MQKKVLIKISGPRVQGVGFRFESYQMFAELNLTGKAENGKDGSLEVEAEGEEADLEKFAEWAKKGPVGARVAKVEVKDAV